MKLKKQAERKLRTRTLIQLGGLIQKSGVMDAFHITPGDDLQDYENLEKASQLLGFLHEVFEKHSYNDMELKRVFWIFKLKSQWR